MAAIDITKFPESTRQSLLAASYKMALEFFKDPAVWEEYEEWLARRKAAQEERRQIVNKKVPPPVCETGDGGGNPNMITHEHHSIPATVLSNGGFCDG